MDEYDENVRSNTDDTEICWGSTEAASEGVQLFVDNYTILKRNTCQVISSNGLLKS